MDERGQDIRNQNRYAKEERKKEKLNQEIRMLSKARVNPENTTTLVCLQCIG